MAQSPEGLALVSLCRALRISCHTSWHPSVRAMNPPPMATELTPLRPASGKRASFSLVSWKTAATVVGCVAFAGVSAYASGLVPASSLGMARLGSEDVEGADPSHPDPEPATTRWTPPASPTSSTRTTRWGTSAPSWTCRPASSCAPTRRILRRSSPRRSRTTIPRAPISTQRWPIAFVSRRSAWTTASSGSTTLKSQPTPRRRCRRGDAQDACPRGQRAKLRPGTVPGLYRGKGRRGGRRRRGSLERDLGFLESPANLPEPHSGARASSRRSSRAPARRLPRTATSRLLSVKILESGPGTIQA